MSEKYQHQIWQFVEQKEPKDLKLFDINSEQQNKQVLPNILLSSYHFHRPKGVLDKMLSSDQIEDLIFQQEGKDSHFTVTVKLVHECFVLLI